MNNFNRNDKPGFKRNFPRKDFGNPRYADRGGRSEMHKAVCDKCGKDCEIPFKPSMGKPVYCRECFTKNNENGGDPNRFQDRGFKRPDFKSRDAAPSQPRSGQLEAIERKLDKIIKMLSAPVVAVELVKDVADLKEEKKAKAPKPKKVEEITPIIQEEEELVIPIE